MPDSTSSGGSLLQGEQLPATVTTTQTQATAPEFYTNYLQDIANLGQNAVQQGGVAGFGPLQQQAFQMAPEASFAGAGTLGNAANLTQAAGQTTAPSIINQYMNPYTKNVVDEMARLQQQNIQRNIMPALASAGVGTGGFGSKRQATATGQSLADMQANLLGQQYGALNTGYKDAMAAAQADLSRGISAGTALSNIGANQNAVGLGGLKQLYDFGAQQQALGQKQLDYPMTAAQNFAKLMQGYTIPSGSTTQVTAPGQQGQFSNSPLSMIIGLLTALGSFQNSGATTPTTPTT